MIQNMTPLQRVLTTLSHKEPDRVPVFLLLTMHGAKELGMSLPQYYANPANMVEAQMRMAARFDNDCLYAFWCAAAEAQAFGSEAIYHEDGPPNVGQPIARRAGDLLSRPLPDPRRVSPLKETLDAIHRLAQRNQGHRPIVGVILAPFSLPIVLLGLEGWINALYSEPDNARRLVEYISEFCVNWANAQAAAGAHAIAFFDPMASATMVTADQFADFDLATARKSVSQIKSPCVFHFASSRAGAILDRVSDLGTVGVAVGALDDLKTVKTRLRGRMTILGTLNGIQMARWTAAEAESAVKECIAAAAPGGGFILSDQHGEIPFYVPDDTLHAIVQAAHRWGAYPLDWLNSSESGA